MQADVPNPLMTLEPPITDEIERLIARFGRVLSLCEVAESMAFRPQLEASFVADTALARSRELRLTMGLGLGCYYATSVLDGILVPDLHCRGLMLRLLLLPLLVTITFYVPTMQGSARERCTTVGSLAMVGSLIVIAAASASAYAPYALATATLATIYANTTLPLRFAHACISTAAALLGIMLTAHSYKTAVAGLPVALDLQALIGGVFSLFATFRLERGARLTYLLLLKEQRRLDDVAAEREVFSALSQTDRLTGLGNRLRLDRWYAAIVGGPADENLPVGVLMIDIDEFKNFNDFYGHGAGDRCLQAVAETIGAVPQSAKDLAIRYGGEEFAVILAERTASEAVLAARRLLAAVGELRLPHAARTNGTNVVTISIGVAHTVLRPGSKLHNVMDMADNALYAAKRNGRNCVEVAPEPALLARPDPRVPSVALPAGDFDPPCWMASSQAAASPST